MSSAKITNSLKEIVQNAQPHNEIEIVIELTPPLQTGKTENASRDQKIANLKQAFNNGLQPIANEISNKGGSILGSAWINQTVSAKVPTDCIEGLAMLKEVNAIDLPSKLQRD